MTDDLVKRLRVPDPCCEEHHTQNEAADRIERLEREVERRIEPEQVEKLIEIAEPIMAELYAAECAYRKEAEALLDKAVEALREASSFLWHMTNAIDDEDYKGPHDGFNVPLVCHVQPYHDLHVEQLKTQAEKVDATLAEIAPYGLEGEK